jgi:hypothetical protein
LTSGRYPFRNASARRMSTKMSGSWGLNPLTRVHKCNSVNTLIQSAAEKTTNVGCVLWLLGSLMTNCPQVTAKRAQWAEARPNWKTESRQLVVDRLSSGLCRINRHDLRALMIKKRPFAKPTSAQKQNSGRGPVI